MSTASGIVVAIDRDSYRLHLDIDLRTLAAAALFAAGLAAELAILRLAPSAYDAVGQAFFTT
jgi:hypothetical protein